MKLFELKNWQVKIKEEVAVLLPFKAILDRDKSKDKTTAIKELSFVFFFTDYRSDFLNTVNEQERAAKIIQQVGLGDWKPDKVIMEAIEFYNSTQETITLKMIKSAHIAIDKINNYLENINFTIMDKSGKPVHSAKQVADTIKQIGPIRKSLLELEIQAKSELEASNMLRGNRPKGMYVD